MKRLHYISGLPRSGSTLLSTILKQNPRFHAAISTNLLSFVRANLEVANQGPKATQNQEQTKRILHSITQAFYADNPKEVIFDTNRLWTNLLPVIHDQDVSSRVICCVRDINYIIDSFERLHQKNPYSISTVFPSTVDMHVYSRSGSLMGEGGIVRLPYDSLKSAITGMHSDKVMIVEYNLLCQNPEGVLRSLYQFIGEPYFDHDFDNVEISYDEFDKEVNLKGLHTTRKRVEYIERDLILPPDIIEQYRDLEVWRQL